MPLGRGWNSAGAISHWIILDDCIGQVILVLICYVQAKCLSCDHLNVTLSGQGGLNAGPISDVLAIVNLFKKGI